MQNKKNNTKASQKSQQNKTKIYDCDQYLPRTFFILRANDFEGRSNEWQD